MDNSQQALAQLQQAQTAARNPQDILVDQQTQLGIPGQRNTVQGLRGAIDNTTKLLKQVAPSVMGRTQSSLVTNAQATRQIGNEQAPIAQNLNDQGLAYGRASEDLDSAESRALQAAQLGYTGQQDRLSYLQNIYNNLYQRESDEKNRQAQLEQSRISAAGAGSGGGYDLSFLNDFMGQSATKPKANSETIPMLFEDYDPKNATQRRYTEDVVIPELVRLGLTKAAATKKAYEYRKSKFGE